MRLESLAESLCAPRVSLVQSRSCCVKRNVVVIVLERESQRPRARVSAIERERTDASSRAKRAFIAERL